MGGVIKGIGKGIGKFAQTGLGGPLLSAGLGIAGEFLGGRGGTETTTGIDPFVDPFRRDLLQRAQRLGTGSFDPASINQFMNPFQKQVEAATIADFNRQRSQLSNSVAEQATRAGAFGGSRQAVLEASGLAELGQAEAGTLANLRFSGFQDALNRAQADPFQRLGFFRDTLSGVPQSQILTTRQSGNPLNRILGGAAAGLSIRDLLRGRGVPAPRAPHTRITAQQQIPLRGPSGFPSFGF